jgi:formate dehydrogenase major subunit
VHIQESKAATCDIRPGRRPRGKALIEFMEDYRKRAGMDSGLVPVGGRAPVDSVSGEAKPGGGPAAVQPEK